jgi:MbtH protein
MVLFTRRGAQLDKNMFTVVANREQQYSIRPGERPIPAGWASKALCGSREECLEYARCHWLDMTPAGLKK